MAVHPSTGESLHTLCEKFAVIGRALLVYESAFRGKKVFCLLGAYGRNFPIPKKLEKHCDQALIEFQRDLAIVSTAHLRAYLESLLDMGISDDKLFIKAKSGYNKILWLSGLFGIITSLAIGLIALEAGLPFLIALMVTLLSAAPFAVIMHCAPRNTIERRLMFAQLLTSEINRRIGPGNKDIVRVNEVLLEKNGRTLVGTPFVRSNGEATRLYQPSSYSLN